MTRLVEATDEHFQWFARGEGRMEGLSIPPGGIEDPAVLPIVRRMTARLREAGCLGSFLMVQDDEVVGTCGYKWPPRGGSVEIGYGVSASRRRLGHATRGLAALLDWARRDPAVQVVTAETAVGNHPSHRVLAANGFAQVGSRYDREDGDLILWRIEAAS
jgi:RimJ/RimL family protein N-acetyltransferase